MDSNRASDEPRTTPFQRRVYEVVRCIPAGRVATYAAVAAAMGTQGARAVGQALRRNPFAPEVPCHRVIASDGTPGGFGGARGGPALGRKLALLAEEGVVFRAGRLADPSRRIEIRKRQARAVWSHSEDAIANRRTVS